MKVLALAVLLAVVLGGTASAETPICSTPITEVPSKPPVQLELLGAVTSSSTSVLVSALKDAKASKAPVVILEINSPGGQVYPGFELIRQIEKMKGTKVVCVADIQAESMAFVILQSCGLRIMTKRTALMIHEPYIAGSLEGPLTQTKMRNTIEDSKATSRAFNEYVAHQMKLTYAKYTEHVRGGRDWYMNHDEAIKQGAVDEVVDTVNEVLERYGP